MRQRQVEKPILSLARIARYAGGSANAMRYGAATIIFRWWPESGGSSERNLRTGKQRLLAKLAMFPIPLTDRPLHGSREGIERVREQARIQVQGRSEKKLVHEMILPVVEGMGFCRLPVPSVRMTYFWTWKATRLSGESGMQYLFGFAFKNINGGLNYEKSWALNREEEKTRFRMAGGRNRTTPRRRIRRMHVYHFGAYEPSALKRLMGMYATREDEIDRMLRAGVLVDVHQAFKQSTRASVEEYSLKKLEAFYGFERNTPLDVSRAAMRYVEHRFELGWNDEELPEKFREAMEGYNSEDCFSTAATAGLAGIQAARSGGHRNDCPPGLCRQAAILLKNCKYNWIERLR